MESYIELKRVSIHAFHGTTGQERKVGNDYLIRVRVYYDISNAIKSDSLSDTLNYADLYDIVKCEMTIPSNLLECAAGRIIAAIKRNFPAAVGGEIEVEKIKPPISGDVSGATVFVKW